MSGIRDKNPWIPLVLVVAGAVFALLKLAGVLGWSWWLLVGWLCWPTVLLAIAYGPGRTRTRAGHDPEPHDDTHMYDPRLLDRQARLLRMSLDECVREGIDNKLFASLVHELLGTMRASRMCRKPISVTFTWRTKERAT